MDIYQVLQQARQKKYAIGSFNFSSAEILKAIILAASDAKSSIIVSTSEGEADCVGMRQAAALVDAWRKETGLDIFLNLDHGKSLEKVKEAVGAGYNMAQFDGSKLPYEENIAKTKEVTGFCHANYIFIEGELGYLRGSSSLHEEALEIKEEDLTSPEQALDFIEKTGVDSLAIVIGNAHGVFTKSPEKLYIDRLKAINEAVGDKAFLVLHGGSGVPEEDVKQAIENGIVKINLNTELRLAYQSALKKFLVENPDETTPYKILAPATEAVKEVVKNKISLFKNED